MKPRNKFQARVVEVSKRLPKLTQTQIEWAYDNVIEHIGRRTDKGKITCTKCGHAWQGHGELISTLCDHACPHCKADLKIVTTNKRVFKGSYYMTIISKCQEFQVLRTVMINCVAKVGQLPQYTHSEVMQRWVAPDGKHCTFARLRQTMGTMYFDSWIYHTPLEIRQENDVYNRIPIGVIYHRQSLTTELKRTGYKKNLYRQKPLHLFKILLTDCRAETLIKSGYTRLLERIINSGWTKIENYWASIRIAIRNKYKITDATLWCDYIDLLRFFGKDLHNAKYICPHDFTKEHDKYVAKKAKVEKKITSLESERQAFNRSKSSSIFKFEDTTRTIEGNTDMISRMTKDLNHINSVIKVDKDGERLNPIKLDGVIGSDIKMIGDKLNQLSGNARTNGEYFKIGELYGFKLLVKTEESQKEGSMFRDNRFFIEGEGSIKYNYNNGHIANDPKLASMNFLNALDKIPALIEKYQNENTRLSKDLPILQEVMNDTWKKEDVLKDLKSELSSLDRKIQLTLSSKDVVEEKAEEVKAEKIKPAEIRGVQQEYRGLRM